MISMDQIEPCYQLLIADYINQYFVKDQPMFGILKKGDEIQELIQGAHQLEKSKAQPEKKNGLVHTIRAVIVVIDLTKSINMKDFKPSRLSIVTSMLKYFLKKAKESTPIIQFAFAIVEQEICKFKNKFTFNESSIFDQLDKLKVLQQPGNFSLENTLRSCMDLFEDVALQFNREVLIIQSSPLTKDHRDIFETINIFKNSGIKLDIISMVGWTNAYVKLIEAVKGKYVTVNSGEEFKKMIGQFALPPVFDQNKVKISKMKIGLCKKQTNQTERLCFCHFQRCKTYFVCNICEATICKQPPVQCPVCQNIIVLPTDLYNHVILNQN